MKYQHMIHHVHEFSNGCVAVFDQNGKQMPTFQGVTSDKLIKKIHDRVKRQKHCPIWKKQL